MKKSLTARRRSEAIAGKELNGWRLAKKIGSGGNGVVWRATKDGLPNRAIKILQRVSPTSYARFTAEVQALSMAKDIEGIIPVLESHLPDLSSGDTPWFAMPLAEQFDMSVSGKEPIDVVREFVLLAQTLSELHGMQIFHRDIKPANLLALGGRLCFSDFGLVKFPARGDITPLKQDVGPKFTMAPEMRRDALHADPGPADVYSFSKALWIALTKQPLAFDGQYVADSYVGLKRYLSGVYTTTLDELISACTDNDPSARPPIQMVLTRLKEWIELAENFEQRNLKEWVEVQDRLFPLGAPRSASWTDMDAICQVLNLVAGIPSLNHMFFPDGGGMTIEGVSRSAEDGLIVLHHGFHTVLKPAKLTFESSAAGSKWNYFRLEAAPIDPVEPIEEDEADFQRNRYSEAFCEIRPGEYVDPSAWEYAEYADQPLPAGARPVTRYLKGSFVIFSTRSDYNLNPDTYDARHEKMTEPQFRDYIARHANRPSSL
jgi:serine/threonine-protein kinase